MQPVVIWATLPGFQYTDPHLPSWLHFDPHKFLFSGQPPVSSSAYNLTLNIYGIDQFGNMANTTFTIDVFPNTNCTAKYTQLNMTCNVGEFCSLTIQPDYFIEAESEYMTYSLYNISNTTWAHWSDLNYTLYGIPSKSGNVTAVVQAKDVVGLTCLGNISVTVKDLSSSAELSLWLT